MPDSAATKPTVRGSRDAYARRGAHARLNLIHETPATTSQRSTISRLREPDDRKSVLPRNGRARQAHD
jgi:hypothetical protein